VYRVEAAGFEEKKSLCTLQNGTNQRFRISEMISGNRYPGSILIA
jgi:hypothetical protein